MKRRFPYFFKGSIILEMNNRFCSKWNFLFRSDFYAIQFKHSSNISHILHLVTIDDGYSEADCLFHMSHPKAYSNFFFTLALTKNIPTVSAFKTIPIPHKLSWSQADKQCQGAGAYLPELHNRNKLDSFLAMLKVDIWALYLEAVFLGLSVKKVANHKLYKSYALISTFCF